MQRSPFPALLASMSVAACTVGPSNVELRPAVAPGWMSAANPHPIDDDWWHSFDDPQLVELVELAVRNNHDVREAEARLREARALRDAARGRAGPDVAFTGAATENRVSENGQLPVASVPGLDPRFSLFDLGFDASWEIDLWGRARRSVEAADARAEAMRGSAARRHPTGDRRGRPKLCRSTQRPNSAGDCARGRRRAARHCNPGRRTIPIR